MNRIKIFVVLPLVLMMLITGCAGGGAGDKGAVFIEGQSGGDAETLNWILAADSTSRSYTEHTLDSLVTYNNEFNIELRCLAKDIEVSPDGLVYTVTIRDDLKWSDGSSVTAEDYVYTMENLMFSDWLNYNYKGGWQEEVNGETVFVLPETVDETVFTITRQTIEPEFVYTVYDLIPYPKYIAEKYEGDVESFTQAPEFNNLTYTGNLGPYKFKEWIRNDRYVLERNPEYYLGKDVKAPYFDKYIIKLFGTSATRQAALEAGDITYTGIEPAQANKFRNLEAVDVYTVPTGGYSLLAYNQKANGWDGLKDKQIRQALSMAVSKEVMCQSILLGFAEPAFSFIPKNTPWYTEEGIVKYGVDTLFDKKRAVEIFSQAGYGIENDDGTIQIVDGEGMPLTLTLVTSTGSEVSAAMAFQIKRELNDIGIEIDFKLVPWETLLRTYVMNTVQGADQEPRFNNGPEAVSSESWDLVLMSLSTDALAPSGSSIFFTTDGGLNYFGYSSLEVDEMFKRAKSEEALDEEVRRQIYAELSRLLSEEQPINFLAFNRVNHGFQSNVSGIEPGMNMGYNYHLWYFE